MIIVNGGHQQQYIGPGSHKTKHVAFTNSLAEPKQMLWYHYSLYTDPAHEQQDMEFTFQKIKSMFQCLFTENTYTVTIPILAM